MFQFKTIRSQIIFWVSIALLLATGIIIIYSAITLRNTAIELAKDNIQTSAELQASNIKSEIEVALDIANTIAQTFESSKLQGDTLTREEANAIIQHILQENPNLVGISTLWEPNAFDGNDSQYVNAPAHDETGRFIPYWSRAADGTISVEALVDYEVEGAGDWYLIPRRTKQEAIIEPYNYVVQGENVLMTSLIAPIIIDDEFHGIVGVDYNLEFLQTLTDNATLSEYGEDGAEWLIISNSDTLSGVTGQSGLVGESVTAYYGEDQEAQILEYLHNYDDSVITEIGDTISVFVPITFGSTNTPWSVNINVPLDAITAQATETTTQLIIISVVIVVASLIVLWFIAEQISRPIKDMTRVAEAISLGDFSTRANETRKDETGILARSFNQMTYRLRQMLEAEQLQRTQLQESETRFRAIFESSVDAVAVSKNDGTYTMVNSSFLEILGYSSEDELIGRSVLSVIAPIEHERVKSYVQERSQGKYAPPEYETVGIRKDGTIFDMDVHAFTYKLNREIFTVAVIRDITEKKQSERVLRESEERYRALFENAPIGIAVSIPKDMKSFQAGGRVLMVNAAWERLHQRTKDEMNQMTPHDTYPNVEDRKRLLEKLEQDGAVSNFEVARLRGNGSTYISNLTIVPFPTAGEGAVLLMEIDITEHRNAEEERQKAAILQAELEKERELSAIKDRFVSMVSHEFRTPLAVIKTSSDILSRYLDKLDDMARSQKFQQIQEQIERLTGMVDGTLNISRAQQGKMEYNPSPVDLESFCRNILDQVQFTDSTEHQFEFISRTPEEPVMIDGNLMQHVLTNLLANAIKYSPAKSRIGFQIDCDDDHITIAVSDEGIGIPEEDQARLFEPFHRASNVGNVQGTGIGLSIVKEYVKLHGGSIEVESEIGKGSTFRITLPLV